MKFIRPTIVRKYVNERGRKITKSFLVQLDTHVAKVLEKACTIHNGGKKMLDVELLAIVIKL